MATPRYRLSSPAFFPPSYVNAGELIDFDGPPGPHMVPVNDEAKAKVKSYYKDRPDATITPAENLPMTVSVVAAKPVTEEPVFRVPGMREDADDMGSNAPTVKGTLGEEFAPTAVLKSLGDPTKPGEGGEPIVKQTAEVDKANAKATEKK